MIKKWRKMSQNLEQKSPFACLSLINTGNYTAGRWRNKSQGRWWRERLCEKKKHLPALRWGTRKIKDGKKNWILQSLPFLLCLVRRGGGSLSDLCPLSLQLASLLLLSVRGYAKMLPFSIRWALCPHSCQTGCCTPGAATQRHQTHLWLHGRAHTPLRLHRGG